MSPCSAERHDVLLNLGSYNEEFTCQDGYDIWIRFIEKYRPYNVNIPLFYYRQHGVSLTKNEHKILDTRREIKKSFIKNKGGIKRKVVGFIPVIMSSIYHLISTRYRKSKPNTKNAKHLLSLFMLFLNLIFVFIWAFMQ